MRIPLTKMIDGYRPGLVISPRCKALRKGFNSTYRYRRVNITGEHRYMEEPEKNDASHPHDAAQYVLLEGGEYHDVMGWPDARQSAAIDQTHAITEDNPYGTFTGGRGDGQAYAITE